MSVDLVVSNNISASPPQVVTDQNGNPSALLLTSQSVSINSATSTGATLVFGSAGAGEWIQNSYYTSNTHGLAFFCNSSQAMTLFAGNLGVGITNPTSALHVNGTVKFAGLPGLPSSGTLDLVVDPTGAVTTQSSSARFKENIRNFTTDFSRILGLKPVAFTYKQKTDKVVGYLAEDVASQGLDELVARDGEGKPMAVHYKLISVYLVELVKQQQAMIEALQEKMAKVEGRFEDGASPATA